MDYFAENISIIEERWPEVAQALRNASEVGAVVAQHGPHPTLVIEGIHLSSSYDRRREARIQASLVPDQSEEAWVYGIGAGDLPRELLARPGLRRLHVVFLNTSVVRCVLTHLRQRDWLEDGRVNLLTSCAQVSVNFPFSAVPSCLRLADDASARLRDLVHLELATPFIRKRVAGLGAEMRSRFEENISFIQGDEEVTPLFGTCTGKSIIVAGAGPTLSAHYERLRSRTSLLMAVDAALKPLLEAGVVPDFVFSVDPHRDLVRRFFSEVDLAACDKSRLIYFPTVHRDILEIWPGIRHVAYARAPLYNELKQRVPKAELFASGSVIHPAIDLAVKMGAPQIFLVGADFSYPGNRSHVEGCTVASHQEPTGHWVLNGHGDRVSTTPNMRGFLRDLEAYIMRHDDVVFVNCSAAGAQISGTRFLESFDEL